VKNKQDPMKSFAANALRKVVELTGGHLKPSRRNVPYILYNGNLSCCYFKSTKRYRVFHRTGNPNYVDGQERRDFEKPEQVADYLTSLGYKKTLVRSPEGPTQSLFGYQG